MLASVLLHLLGTAIAKWDVVKTVLTAAITQLRGDLEPRHLKGKTFGSRTQLPDQQKRKSGNLRKGKKREWLVGWFLLLMKRRVKWKRRVTWEGCGHLQVQGWEMSFLVSELPGFHFGLKMSLLPRRLHRDPVFNHHKEFTVGTLGAGADRGTQKAKGWVWAKRLWTPCFYVIG